MKPKLFMMVGLPGSGKSTWISKYLEENRNPNLVIASSDQYIEEVAARAGITYNMAFPGAAKDAMKYVDLVVDLAIQNSSDLIWDQTNLSVKSRAPRLARFKDYHKTAVYVYCDDAMEHHRRLSNRPGKNIPPKIMNSMMLQLQKPTLSEGFDEIIEVPT